MSTRPGRLVHVPAGDGKAYDGKTAKERLAEGEAILRERSLGTPASELMTRFGVSRATLYRRVDEAIAARIVPTVDAYREQQNAHLDDLAGKWRQQLDAADVIVTHAMVEENMSLIERGMKMRGDALTGLLRVAERRSRLMGTDAPVRADITVTDATPNIDARVAALAEEIKAMSA